MPPPPPKDSGAWTIMWAQGLWDNGRVKVQPKWGSVFKSVSLARVRKSPLWPQTLQRMTLVAWEADRVHLAKFLHAQSGSI